MAGVIVARPLLLLTVGFLFIGGVIGIFLAVSRLGVEYRGAPAINLEFAEPPLSVFDWCFYEWTWILAEAFCLIYCFSLFLFLIIVFSL
ncbi:MAG: hypothetical protein ACLSAF_15665 [Intestinimonas sp.]